MQKPTFRRFEWLVVVFCFIAFSGGMSLLSGGDDASANSSMAQILQSPAYAYALLILLLRPEKIIANALSAPILLAITALCAASVIWSIDPSGTLKRSILLGMTFLFALSVSVRFSPEDVLRMLGIAFLVIATVTIVTVVMIPSVGVHQDKHYPAIRGLFPHKNIAGNMMVLGYIIGLTLCLARETRALGIKVTGASALLVVLAMSASAMISAAALTVVFWAVGRIQRQRPIFVALAVAVASLVGIAAYGALIEAYGAVLGAADRDTTLTGRTLIWSHLIYLLMQHDPWLGFGYQSFWSSMKGALGTNWGMGAFVPVHAHNGFMQTLASIGLVGVAGLCFLLGSFLYRSIRKLYWSQSAYRRFGLVFWVFLLLTNIAEYSFLSYRSLSWVVFAYLCVSFYQERRKAQRSGAPIGGA